jgi:hypothetical protein
MSHETDPSRLRGDERPTPDGSTVRRLLDAFTRHLAEWPRRYIEQRVEAVDSDR